MKVHENVSTKHRKFFPLVKFFKTCYLFIGRLTIEFNVWQTQPATKLDYLTSLYGYYRLAAGAVLNVSRQSSTCINKKKEMLKTVKGRSVANKIIILLISSSFL